jgi:hypothetical protein
MDTRSNAAVFSPHGPPTICLQSARTDRRAALVRRTHHAQHRNRVAPDRGRCGSDARVHQRHACVARRRLDYRGILIRFCDFLLYAWRRTAHGGHLADGPAPCSEVGSGASGIGVRKIERSQANRISVAFVERAAEDHLHRNARDIVRRSAKYGTNGIELDTRSTRRCQPPTKTFAQPALFVMFGLTQLRPGD